MNAVNAPHPDREILQAFALGKLDDPASEQVSRHLEVCSDCQRQVADVPDDSLLESLRQSNHAEKTPAPVNALTSWSREAGDLPAELLDNDQYEILRPLGAGGMGVVYLARNRWLERLEVLKVIRTALVDKPGVLERFLREIRAAAGLNHDNVVKAHSVVQFGGLLVFAMEYVPGEDLALVVKIQGPLPIRDACEYICQAARGLQHAHEKGLVHRDIKPANLIRARDGDRPVVKILDFGLARMMLEETAPPKQLTGEGTVMGTVDYIAPEQARDSRKADIRADIYSLGCTLYHLLSGRVPFPEGTIIDKILERSINNPESLSRLRPDLPEGLARLVEKMMARKPDDRYQTPGEVATALEPFSVRGERTSLTPNPRTPPPNPLPGTERGSRKSCSPLPCTQGRGVGGEGFLSCSPPSLLGRGGWGVRGMRSSPMRWVLAVLLLVGAVAAGIAIYRIQTDQGELIINTQSENVEVVVKKGGKVVRIIDSTTNKEITLVLRSGNYDLELLGAPRGLKLSIDRVNLMRGKTVLAKIERIALPKALPPKDRQTVAPKWLEVSHRVSHAIGPRHFHLFIEFSVDSRLCVACGHNTFRIWEVETGKRIREELAVPEIVNMQFLPDGKHLLSSHTDGEFRLWDLTKRKPRTILNGTPGWIGLGGITPAGDCFCFSSGSGLPDRRLTVSNLEPGKERFHVKPFQDKSSMMIYSPLSPDGKRAMTIDQLAPDKGLVRIFDVATGKRVLSIPTKFAHDNQAWSADSKRIYVNVCEQNSQAHLIACFDSSSGELISQVPLTPGLGSTWGRRFSRDGRCFGVVYPKQRLVHLYDTSTGKLVGKAAGQYLEWALTFSPDGRFLACGVRGEVLFYRLAGLPLAKVD